MHKFIKESLENYLRGSLEQSALAEFRRHLEQCRDCREEVAAMEAQAGLMHLLGAPAAEPDSGFYARVVQRIEAQRAASIPYSLSEPALGWRFGFAALVAILVMGLYLFYSERAPAFGASSPVTIMAVGPEEYGHVGANVQQDRQTVLVALASYQE